MKKHFLSFVLGAMLVSAPVFATDLYLIGDATSAGWTIESAVQMTETSENVFEWSGDLKIGELKFLTQKDAWIPSYGPVTVDEEMVTGDVDLQYREDDETPGSDHKFKVTACGWYTLVVDLTDAEKPSLSVSVFYPSTMYLIGPAVGGWSWDDNGQQMSAEEEGIFTWKGSLSAGEFKFFEQKDFGATAYGANVADTEVAVPGEYELEKLGSDDKKFIATEGLVILTLDLKQMKLIAKTDSTTGLENVTETSSTIIYDLRGLVCPRMEKGGVYILKQGNKSTKVIAQ